MVVVHDDPYSDSNSRAEQTAKYVGRRSDRETIDEERKGEEVDLLLQSYFCFFGQVLISPKKNVERYNYRS